MNDEPRTADSQTKPVNLLYGARSKTLTPAVRRYRLSSFSIVLQLFTLSSHGWQMTESRAGIE